MFNKQDRIQLIIAAACTVIAAILCFTVLPEEMELMQGGKLKSNLCLMLLTALPALVTWVVAIAGKNRLLSWTVLAFTELYGAMQVIGTITEFTFPIEILFHSLFLVLELGLAIYLTTVKGTDKKLMIRFQWITSVEGMMAEQKVAAQTAFILAAAEAINMLLSIFDIYSFTMSAGITIVLCYAAFLVMVNRLKKLS